MDNPPKYAKIGLLNKLIFCYIATNINAANVEKKVAIRMGKNMSEGCAAPASCQYAIIEIGRRVRLDAFKTINMICALLAASLLGFSSCNSFMAFKPNGVAALSNPNAFAEKFIKIEPKAG